MSPPLSGEVLPLIERCRLEFGKKREMDNIISNGHSSETLTGQI